MFVVEVGDEFIEEFVFFAVEEEGGREHAVTDGVAGGDFFAGIGDGAARFRAVGPGSDFLFEGAHCGLSIAGAKWRAEEGC